MDQYLNIGHGGALHRHLGNLSNAFYEHDALRFNPTRPFHHLLGHLSWGDDEKPLNKFDTLPQVEKYLVLFQNRGVYARANDDLLTRLGVP